MRDILFFNPDATYLSSRILLAENGEWPIHSVGQPDEALNLSQKHRILVGLVQFPINPGESVLHKIEKMINIEEKIRWFAILDKMVLENQSVKQILADGFYDYFSLPIDENRLMFSLGHAWGMAEIGISAKKIEKSFNGQAPEMVGTSSAVMRSVMNLIQRFSSIDVPVLVTGETGTGKELVSRAIHDHSARASHPFISVNCGALPTNLIQTELFGHEKGSFTGAHQQKIGRIEMASGGTIFLDEIGDLPLELQANLLRFLQERTYERVGGTKSLTADIRVISATNADLEKMVREGRFREDLFYRLNVLKINLPPLRERSQDIEPMARFFTKKFSKELNKAHLATLSQQAIKCIQEYSWPGNVRELINRIRRALVMCENRLIMPADLELSEVNGSGKPPDLKSIRARSEKEKIQETLEKTEYNISKGAMLLGISRVTLYSLIRKYGVDLGPKKRNHFLDDTRLVH